MNAGQIITLSSSLDKLRESLIFYKDKKHEKVQKNLKEVISALEAVLGRSNNIKKQDVTCWAMASDFEPGKESYDTYYVQTEHGWIVRVSDSTNYITLPPITLCGYKKIPVDACKGIDSLLSNYVIHEMSVPGKNGKTEAVKVLAGINADIERI